MSDDDAVFDPTAFPRRGPLGERVTVTVRQADGAVLTGSYPVQTVRQAVFSAATDTGLWHLPVVAIAFEVARG